MRNEAQTATMMHEANWNFEPACDRNAGKRDIGGGITQYGSMATYPADVTCPACLAKRESE